MLSKKGLFTIAGGRKNTGLCKQTASCFAMRYQMIPKLWLIKEPALYLYRSPFVIMMVSETALAQKTVKWEESRETH